MGFLQQLFLQPAMLFGTLLVGIPIVIYLINRQRYTRRRWAAMEFLLRALKKNRRRIQLENLLLLLIRCAVLCLLALAMARPFLRNTSLSAISTGPQNWIFAVDTSYSMDFRDGTRTLLEAARETMEQMVLDTVKPGDRLALMTFGSKPRVVLRPRQVTESSRAEILRQIEEVETGHDSVDVVDSLQRAIELAREFETSTTADVPLTGKKLVVFSDFQRRDWVGESGPKDPAIISMLEELKDDAVQVSFANLAASDRNLVLADLMVRPAVTSRDVWMEIVATVTNTGREDYEAAELAFIVDGNEDRTHVLRVPAGSTQSRSLPYRFADSGFHSVTAEVRGDSLPTDNARHMALDVLDGADLLLLDGEPGDRPIERETLLLELALMPEDSDEFRRTPYRPVYRTVDQLLDDGVNLDDCVAVVMANVSLDDVPGTFVEEVEKYVRRGGSLIVFCGKNTLPEDYNRVFHDGGAGLMPLKMIRVEDVSRDPIHFRLSAEEHPVANYFLAREDRSYLNRDMIEIKRFVKFDPPDDAAPGAAPVSTMASFSDAEGSPAIFDAPHGGGRVMWVATTADLEWNDFAKYPDFVPFVHEAIPYLVRFGENRLNLSLGEPIRASIDAADYAPDVVVLPPRPEGDIGAGIPATISKKLTKEDDDERFSLVHEQTNRPGVYRIRMSRPGGGEGWTERELVYAVNLDPREGELRRVSMDEIKTAFAGMEIETFDAIERVQEIAKNKSLAGGSEYWKQILWILLALLVTETLLAHFFGRSLR